MKITKTQLKQIIKEEVSRFQKTSILENRKKEITRKLRMLNESDELGELNIDINTLTKEMLSIFKDGTDAQNLTLCSAKELNGNIIEWCKGSFYKGKLVDNEGLILEIKGVELGIHFEWDGDFDVHVEGEYRPERFSKSYGVWEQAEEPEYSINLDDFYLSKATLVSDTSSVDITSAFKSSGLDEEVKELFFGDLDDETINDMVSYSSDY